jgi:hypothetical protein
MAITSVDVVVLGTALETRGLIGNNTVSGVGLNTLGFLWPCDGIWIPSDSPITTVWTSSNQASTVENCADN